MNLTESYRIARDIAEHRRNLDAARIAYQMRTVEAVIKHGMARRHAAEAAGISIGTLDRWLGAERARLDLFVPLPGMTEGETR